VVLSPLSQTQQAGQSEEQRGEANQDEIPDYGMGFDVDH
jgi:hypothetical protein